MRALPTARPLAPLLLEKLVSEVVSYDCAGEADMHGSTWAYEVRGALELTRDLRGGRTVGAQSTLVSVDATLRSILENPRACDKRGIAAVLRLDVAELGDAIVAASSAEALWLRALMVRLERFAARLQGESAAPLAA